MQESIMQRMWQTAHIGGGSAAYVEDLYERYLRDPEQVPKAWQKYFDEITAGRADMVSHTEVREYFTQLAKSGNRRTSMGAATSQTATVNVSSEHERKQVQVLRLIEAFRIRGHQRAKLDPLSLMKREEVEDLDFTFHGLSENDLDMEFRTGSLLLGKEFASLREVVTALQSIYCGSIGVEYMYIMDTAQCQWFQKALESAIAQSALQPDEKHKLLKLLTAAEGLENYLASRYPGTKRFGLEGGESFIPMLHEIIQQSGAKGTQEVVIGMAHRGRLNVLVNILGKSPADLFDEFEGKRLFEQGSGDVKYHQGFSSSVMTPGGEVHLALSFNPSHLEIVAPVVEGSVRARQERRQDTERKEVLPIVVHGDCAFVGQGVVMETLQLSQTRAYGTGGTIHIIVNNQVGFTTSRQDDVRSSEYCTDVAKIVGAPILHINGDDPEAVIRATRLAVEYRTTFKRDVVLDLVCYRRRGHNEADEPSGTQPLMYAKIKTLKTTRCLYLEQLIAEGVTNAEHSDAMIKEYRQAMDERCLVTPDLVKQPNSKLHVDWSPYLGHRWTADHDTRVSLARLQEFGQKLAKIPEGFVLQRQVGKIIDDRIKMSAGALPFNWGMAEIMAYATLLQEGHPVRITGQDVGRGTFSHRHAVLHNQKDGSTHVPLRFISDKQASIQIYDSTLSEEAVLAFEYGYAASTPNTLVIWEAQFGDFANGAQVVIDQFIASGEHKWGRLCGLTMLLPHGYEGQGPEHSSARLERYLQLCAEHNIQVCVPTTPAQVFHMLRRQVVRPLRKPLIALTPKSLLRHKRATSTLEEIAEGVFQSVMNDSDINDSEKITRLVLCSGKVFYDLYEMRQSAGIEHIAIVRIEQLYPFPLDDLNAVIAMYPNLTSVVWCQEEPMNQGAWYCSQHHMHQAINTHPNHRLYLSYVGREAFAAPACGYLSVHVEQQNKLVAEALLLDESSNEDV